jgi:hypothetical protein
MVASRSYGNGRFRHLLGLTAYLSTLKNLALRIIGPPATTCYS